ncbi:hypothetical protein RQP46_007226 [Phenoliferia psychrophenolica]
MKHPKLEQETFSKGLPVAHLCVEGKPRKPSWSNPLGLPEPLTAKQLFYIWGPQCIGAAVIDGAVNFGIACAMYRSQDNITMWTLAHNTVAGDMAVTTFIQGILTFVIASSMVHVDMRKGTIAAFPYPWPDQVFAVVQLKDADPETAKTKRGKLWRTCHSSHGLGRGLHFFSGSATNDLLDFSLSRRDFFDRLFWSVWKGSVLSALYFLVFWPIGIACVAPKWGGLNMAHTWTPQIIKLVYAFLLGLFMNPVVACIALGSEDAVRDHRREVHDAGVQEMEEAVPAANTRAETVRAPERAFIQVAGAGIAGLSVALGLARAGYKNVTIYEASRVVKEVGAALQCAPNATRALKVLGIFEQVRPLHSANARLSIRRYNDDVELGGAIFTGFEAKYGSPAWAFHRADLHEALRVAALASGVVIQTGSTVRGVDFDGTRLLVERDRRAEWVEADVIFGADGIKSVLRKAIFDGENEDNHGESAYNPSKVRI